MSRDVKSALPRWFWLLLWYTMATGVVAGAIRDPRTSAIAAVVAAVVVFPPWLYARHRASRTESRR